ncbi:MAG: ISAzo13-like element transposase-related protein [Acidiferrobacter sp.]
MSCPITQNWRGHLFLSHEVIINLIANTTTRASLGIRAERDSAHYPAGIKVTDAELRAPNLKFGPFHGDGTVLSFLFSEEHNGPTYFPATPYYLGWPISS